VINGHRVIAVEEHFATTSYLDATAMLPIWAGDETEMALMRAVQSAPVMRDRLADLGTRRPDNRYAWTYRAAAASLGMVRLELAPSEYLRRNFTLTTSGMDDPQVLALCLDQVGDDNVMFAIDYPYEDSAPATASLRDTDLTDTQRAKISHRNAERLLRLPPANWRAAPNSARSSRRPRSARRSGSA